VQIHSNQIDTAIGKFLFEKYYNFELNNKQYKVPYGQFIGRGRGGIIQSKVSQGEETQT
jgi:hypothetical protein